MPSTLPVRRANGFRPATYSERHEHVAVLLASGLPRDDIARLTGYSSSHVSRISRMPDVRHAVIHQITADAVSMLDALIRRLTGEPRPRERLNAR